VKTFWRCSSVTKSLISFSIACTEPHFDPLQFITDDLLIASKLNELLKKNVWNSWFCGPKGWKWGCAGDTCDLEYGDIQYGLVLAKELEQIILQSHRRILNRTVQFWDIRRRKTARVKGIVIRSISSI